MNPTETVVAAPLVGTRRSVYQFLLAALAKPGPAQHAWLRGAGFGRGLELLCESFGLELPEGTELVPSGFADHESRYLACFEVGLPQAPVVLQASFYVKHEPAPRVVHEHVLFYRHFGYETRTHAEAADHLLNELGFLVHLDMLAEAPGADLASLRAARRDFLCRQMARWVESAALRAAERFLPPLYRVLLALLAAAVRQDVELLAAPDFEASIV